MSIGVIVNVHDGMVLAADSASTLTLNTPAAGGPVALNVYNNANKIVNLCKGESIGCVTYGAGSIGSASISTLLKDFRKRLQDGVPPESFDRNTFTVEGVSNLLRNFVDARIRELNEDVPKPTLGVMVAGISKAKSLGEAWVLNIANGVSQDPVRLRAEGDVGINWGGDLESTSRLVVGFSPVLLDILAAYIQPPPQAEQLQELRELLANTLQAPLAFAPMPIQDAIDLAEWLVYTAEMFSRFMPVPTSVGGLIESAAITKHEGFRWIHRKHYYNRDLNPAG